MRSENAQKQRMASAFNFSERHHEIGKEFLHHIVPITGDKTWVSSVNIETNE
jgi:hypothetical protein